MAETFRSDPFGSWDTWDDRLHILIPFDREKQDYVDYSTSRLFAAVHPEAVTLAPLIASPHWRRLAGGTDVEQARFLEAIAGRVTYPYSPPDRSGDAIAHWALADSWRPPSRPLTTYTPGRVRGTLPAWRRTGSPGMRKARGGSAAAAGTKPHPPLPRTPQADPPP
ncbi:hypothetical protein [Streptomyces syringium]|uniref:hypothetical protein n=1 Tax=Streptomyces syringium TaxID=76729 RepID=UPI0033D62EA5